MEEDIPALARLIGAQRVLFGSDFPHPEGLAEPRDFAQGLVGLSRAETRQIMGENRSRVLAGGF